MLLRNAPVLLLGICGVLLVGLGGCATSNQSEDEEEDPQTEEETRRVGPELARTAESIRTIQLYRGEDERRLPVLSLQDESSLTLEFDLMEAEGRPLTVRFFPADRKWERTLSPSRAMDSYTDDDLVDYRPSRGTEVDYTHYSYTFPNDDISFQVSGNYVLQVTERGRRDSVLFERPFFVTEDVGSLESTLESFPVPGQQLPSIRPLAKYDPPSSLEGDPFGYAACFVRNGQLGEARCEERPRLGSQPRLEFEVSRRQAFGPVASDYRVDLGNLNAGRRIERADRTVSPFQVLLEPDYARFSGEPPRDVLNGQIVVRGAVEGRSDPALTAEYVRTTFAFVPPDEQPLPGGLTVAGSFSGMSPDQGANMRWASNRRRYEGEVLLKQGRYQYFYEASDPELTEELRRMQSVERQNAFTTFLYYEDPSRGTDRLLQVRHQP
ncbi:MAG: type IX secretion system plug protein domain-containing protein [Salinivenus sp.]